jgi:hypothetical protein
MSSFPVRVNEYAIFIHSKKTRLWRMDKGPLEAQFHIKSHPPQKQQ